MKKSFKMLLVALIAVTLFLVVAQPTTVFAAKTGTGVILNPDGTKTEITVDADTGEVVEKKNFDANGKEIKDSKKVVEGIIDDIDTKQGTGSKEATKIASKVASFIWILSIVVSVIVLMYTGLKFIVGSASEKAEYKKSLMPLVVGVLVVLFASTIVKALFSLN